MKRLAQWIGCLWLCGLKYTLSRWLAGPSWSRGFRDIPALRGAKLLTDLELARTLPQVVDAFRGLVHWRPDPLWQLWDVVYPPELLLARGGDDCDGMAMLHAQAVDTFLGPLGWRAFIVSYVARPWTLSHHFALALSPDAEFFAIQPQAAADQPRDLQLFFGPFPDIPMAVKAIARQYAAEVVWYDVRDPHWNPATIPHQAPATAGVSH